MSDTILSFKEKFEAWMLDNMMAYKFVEDDIIDIPEFGKLYFFDSEAQEGVFSDKNKKGEMNLELPVPAGELIDDNVFYAILKWGNGFYYTDLREDVTLQPLKYLGKCVIPKPKIDYVNLGIHSPFELLEGSFLPKEWIKKAKFFGHNTIGICDKNTMGGTLPLQKACKKEDMEFVFGYSLEVRLPEHEELMFEGKVYCSTDEGWSNMLRIQKAVMVDNHEDPHISLDELLDRGKGNVFVFDKLSSKVIDDHTIEKIERAFDKIFYQLDLTEYKADRFDKEVLESIDVYLKKWKDQIPPVLICDNYYLDHSDAKNKIILNKIASGTAKKQSDQQYYKHISEHISVIRDLFNVHNGENAEHIENYMLDLIHESAKNTFVIADLAKAEIDTGSIYMPEYEMKPSEVTKYGDKHSMFLSLLDEGFDKLVPNGVGDKYTEQLDREIYIIESTNNIDYFLVTWDTVNWARENGIQIGSARGSAGGSLVSYLLGITTIDPITYDLIFERFLTPERCGLQPQDVTIVGDDVEVLKGEDYISIETEEGVLNVLPESELMIKRGDETIEVRADELEEEDEIVIDSRDQLWEINKVIIK